MNAAFIALTIFACYLLGSVSFAILVSRVFKLDDPRSYGSKNPGATNVLRSGKKMAAVLTLAGDSLKGFAAVFATALFLPNFYVICAAALAVFLGHLFPVFHKFQGGKGVATAAGVLFALDYRVALCVLGIWIFIAVTTRYSSLAAILAAVSLPFLSAYFLGFESLYLTLAMTALLLFKHRLNIARLIQGKESKIGGKKT